jgi:nitronate monooxygenase
MNTAFARTLGLKVPIFQAPMAGATVPELVLAVGRAGALGGFGFAYTEPQSMKDAVEKVRKQADVPIHINLFVERPAPDVTKEMLREAAERVKPFYEALKLPVPETLPPPYCPDISAQIETALSLKPALLSFQFHPFQPEVIREAKKRGIPVGGAATTLEEAERIDALGVDFIIAQGAEAGGHRATFLDMREAGLVGTLALTRLIVKRCRAPVVAAGGIMDGAGIAAVLALGAQAAQMGTAFLATPESGAPAQHKLALKGRSATTVTRQFSGRWARGIRNRYIEEMEANPGPLLPFPAQHQLTVRLRAESNKQGSPDCVALWAGQAYPLATEAPAGELIARWIDEAKAIVKKMASDPLNP